MPDVLLPSEPPDAEAAVLLALLGSSRSGTTVSAMQLTLLQQQLGPAVHVLRVDVTTHPLVVSSFHATELPCFVLVHHGIELGRTCDLPNAATVLQLLTTLNPAGHTPENS